MIALGNKAGQEAATVDVSGADTFQGARKLVRNHLANTGIEREIVSAVTKLLLTTAGS